MMCTSLHHNEAWYGFISQAQPDLVSGEGWEEVFQGEGRVGESACRQQVSWWWGWEPALVPDHNFELGSLVPPLGAANMSRSRLDINIPCPGLSHFLSQTYAAYRTGQPVC